MTCTIAFEILGYYREKSSCCWTCCLRGCLLTFVTFGQCLTICNKVIHKPRRLLRASW